MAPSELAAMGSIADISARLSLWARQAQRGMARVEFSSEFSRQQVLDRVKVDLAQRQIPFTEIQLPTYRKPMEIVNYLLAELDQQESGVVSINGFSTAFQTAVPLQDAMYALNFNRERFAERSLRQIWWMTPVFYDAAQFAMPDLMSWFNPRLRLTESLVVNSQAIELTESATNIDDARQRAEFLVQQFEKGLQAGAPAEELLKVNLLPALEALAEANAQNDLRDLTNKFEGLLSRVQVQDSPEMASSLDRLGQLYVTQGRYGEAEPLLIKSLKFRRCLFPEEHPSVAASFNNLAELYKNQGRYEEAEPLYLQALRMSQKPAGQEHPDVATSLNNLAHLYDSQGRYEEAELLYLQALQMSQKLLGQEHPDVATSLNNLAGLYANQGCYEEAEPLSLQALQMRQKLLGQEHPDVASSINNLALLYYDQGRYEEAEPLYTQALQMRQKLLGQEHPDVATSFNNLAALYKNQGRYEEAELLYLKALHISQKLLGQEHPSVATSFNNLAALYKNQGRYEEAEPLYLKAFKIFVKSLGQSHPYTKIAYDNSSGFVSRVFQVGQQLQLSNDPLTQAELSKLRDL